MSLLLKLMIATPSCAICRAVEEDSSDADHRRVGCAAGARRRDRGRERDRLAAVRNGHVDRVAVRAPADAVRFGGLGSELVLLYLSRDFGAAASPLLLGLDARAVERLERIGQLRVRPERGVRRQRGCVHMAPLFSTGTALIPAVPLPSIPPVPTESVVPPVPDPRAGTPPAPPAAWSFRHRASRMSRPSSAACRQPPAPALGAPPAPDATIVLIPALSRWRRRYPTTTCLSKASMRCTLASTIVEIPRRSFRMWIRSSARMGRCHELCNPAQAPARAIRRYLERRRRCPTCHRLRPAHPRQAVRRGDLRDCHNPRLHVRRR